MKSLKNVVFGQGVKAGNYLNDMFSGCKKLKSIYFSDFDTSKVTDMVSMFNQCIRLESLDLSGFDTSEVVNMNSMFNGCSSLGSLDLSSFDASKVQYIGKMFENCHNLITIYMSDGFKTDIIQTDVPVFSGCDKLVGGAGTKYNSFHTDKTYARIDTASAPGYLTGRYIVKFNANGGTGTMDNQTFTPGVAQKLNKNTFTKAGYTFTGWNTEADGTGNNYADKEEITVTANITLYAQWTQTPVSYNWSKLTATAAAIHLDDESMSKETAQDIINAKITSPQDYDTVAYAYSEGKFVCRRYLAEDGWDVCYCSSLSVLKYLLTKGNVYVIGTVTEPPTPTPKSSGGSSGGSGTWTSTPTSQGSSSAPINNGTWGSGTTGTWQYKVNGEILKNATAWISYTGADGKPYTGCFYFDKNGNMATGWQKLDNIWYFFDTAPGSTLGMMKTTGWITTDGKQYYVGADGKMLANTTTPDGHRVDATGARID